jgi:(S)-ureidoglycine aminohydrolase
MPLSGYPYSRLPEWPGCEARVLAAPALGAAFVQYMINVPHGQGTKHEADGRVETFLYVLSGDAKLTIGHVPHALTVGGYALVPASKDFKLEATADTVLLVLRKAYERAAGIDEAPPVVGNQAEVHANVYMGDSGALLQTLIPDELPFDMAINIFTFSPGHSLPVVETHVMEHGLWFLEGKGLYYLDDTWMEVEAGDFIWMGPYVPQSFYATGQTPSKYLYYKNVNREIPL